MDQASRFAVAAATAAATSVFATVAADQLIDHRSGSLFGNRADIGECFFLDAGDACFGSLQLFGQACLDR